MVATTYEQTISQLWNTDILPFARVEDFLVEMEKLSDANKQTYREITPNVIADGVDGELSTLIANADVLYLRGIDYFYGHGVEPNEKSAFLCFKSASEKKHPDAMHKLGICYFQGKGVTQNLETAYEIYEEASRLGSAAAHRSLGLCFEHGLGIPRNTNRAYGCYHRAVADGDINALYNLGLCFQDGVGIRVSPKLAIKYFFLAAQHGHHLAVEALKKLKIAYAELNRLESEIVSHEKNVSRDTATKDITTTTNPDIPNSQPPDEISTPFTTAVDAKSIGAMLSDARNEAGITKVTAAQALGKDEKTIRNLEKGQHNSTLPRIQEYADILGYDLEFRLVPRDNS